jgi:hypothetical protein
MADPFDDLEKREPAEQVIGRFVGILVFIVGIILLGATFSIAYRSFSTPDWFLPASLLNSKITISPEKLYLPLVIKLVMLFAMGYFGSLIASRGAQFFMSSKKVHHDESAGN